VLRPGFVAAVLCGVFVLAGGAGAQTASSCKPSTVTVVYACSGAWYTVSGSITYRMHYSGSGTDPCSDSQFSEGWSVQISQTITVRLRPVHVYAYEVDDLVPTNRNFHPRHVLHVLFKHAYVAPGTASPGYDSRSHASDALSASGVLTRAQAGTYSSCAGDPSQPSATADFPAAKCAQQTRKYRAYFAIVGAQQAGGYYVGNPLRALPKGNPYPPSCTDQYAVALPYGFPQNVPDDSQTFVSAYMHCPTAATFVSAPVGRTLVCRKSGTAFDRGGDTVPAGWGKYYAMTAKVTLRRTS
jgi:hypothetical protein